MWWRSAQSVMLWTAMLQAIISGTASVGGSVCSRTAPAAAENAKPATLETNAPENTATLSRQYEATSVTVFSTDAGRHLPKTILLMPSSIHRRNELSVTVECHARNFSR
jgi:hypothetical protein